MWFSILVGPGASYGTHCSVKNNHDELNYNSEILILLEKKHSRTRTHLHTQHYYGAWMKQQKEHWLPFLCSEPEHVLMMVISG